MPELHFPWLECSILIPLVGAGWLRWMGNSPKLGNSTRAWTHAVFLTALTLICATGEWIDFATLGSFEAHDHWDVFSMLFRSDVFVVDELSAPLLPLAALAVFVTVLSTLRTKAKRFSLVWTLVSESILLATLSCRASWVLIALLVLATFPPWLEMRCRGRCTRVYGVHMSVFIVCLVLGYAVSPLARVGAASGANGAMEPSVDAGSLLGTLSVVLLGAASLLRCGVVPVHCWMTDLFEKATFGTAILFVTPLTGAYAAIRLVMPIAPAWAMQSIAVLSLFTSVYAAGLALVQVNAVQTSAVQTDARRFFCYVFLSHASLVLGGLELVTPIGMTGALSVWLSVGMALTGFGLTLRCVEARIGRVVLTARHGLFDQMPTLAGFFLLTGLASIGFPGTVGFLAMELLVEGAVQVYPLVGTIVVFAAALNGIAVMHAFFRIFTGRRSHAAISMGARPAEKVAVLLLSLLILGGGLFPQPGVASRYHAVIELGRHHEAPVMDVSVWNDRVRAVPATGVSVTRQPGQEVRVTDRSRE
ncbi:MAG: proton-conducting transporter membrane subunit [Planctomycetota bacterium]